MPKFVKVNQYNWDETETFNTFLSCNEIVSFTEAHGGTNVATRDGSGMTIKETPEQLLKLIAECED